MLKVAILEDVVADADSLAKMIRDLGHDVIGVAHAVDELTPLLAQHPDLVTIDLNIGDRNNGLGIAICLQAAAPIPILFVTDEANPQEQDEVRTLEGAALVLRPLDAKRLRLGIATAVQRTREALQS